MWMGPVTSICLCNPRGESPPVHPGEATIAGDARAEENKMRGCALKPNLVTIAAV